MDISFGSVKIPLKDILKVLLGGEPERASWANIVLLFRLPKAITACLAGAALAVSGLQMQTLFRNPLAGPFVLGIGAGASLGVALVVLSAAAGGASIFLVGFGLLGDLGIVISAGLGSALALLLVLAVSKRVPNVMTLLILGLLFGYATSAGVNILIYFSSAERIQSYISWTFGSFGNTTWTQLKIFIPVILFGLFMTLFTGKALNALLLGESYAGSMGLTVRRARIWLILSTAMLTGAVTAFCGPIAFLGVAIPHLCRSLLGTSDHRVLLPAAILIGAASALLADLIAQVPGFQIVLPLNSVTSLIGAPVIIGVILGKKNIGKAFAA